MSSISPNFDVKLIFFFPILARGLFPKLLEKALKAPPLLVESMDNFIRQGHREVLLFEIPLKRPIMSVSQKYLCGKH